MLPHNDCEKLSKVELKLLFIIKILQKQSCCNENFILISRKNSSNRKHKNKVSLNNSSVKKNSKEKMNTECIFPIEKSNVEDNEKYIPCIQEINTEYDINCNCIKKNISDNDDENFISTLPIITAEEKMDIPMESTLEIENEILDVNTNKKHIFLIDSKVLPIYANNNISPCK